MMQSLLQFLSLVVAAISLVCAVFFYQLDMHRDSFLALCIYLASFLVAVALNE